MVSKSFVTAMLYPYLVCPVSKHVKAYQLCQCNTQTWQLMTTCRWSKPPTWNWRQRISRLSMLQWHALHALLSQGSVTFANCSSRPCLFMRFMCFMRFMLPVKAYCSKAHHYQSYALHQIWSECVDHPVAEVCITSSHCPKGNETNFINKNATFLRLQSCEWIQNDIKWLVELWKASCTFLSLYFPKWWTEGMNTMAVMSCWCTRQAFGRQLFAFQNFSHSVIGLFTLLIIA